MDTTIRTRRKMLAGATVAAPVLLATGNALFPKGSFQYAGTTDKALKALAATAAAPHRVLAASLICIVGMVLLAAAFSGVASLVRRRGGAAATVGAALGVIGTTGAVLVIAWLGLSVYAASQSNLADDAKAGYIVTLLHDTNLGNTVGAPFFGGIVIGSVLLAVGLFRSGRVSRWVAVAFAPAVVFSTVFAPQGIAGAVMGLPLIVVMVLLAREIARDEPLDEAAVTLAPQAEYAATTR
ncbi:MAG: hypothetical protein QOG53_278 [Frankiales bacterium]|jgi:hypothetical protein|nr:hypothetical protein [Frankiales bacterium]